MIAACLSRAEAYTPRSPRKSQYYRCVEANFEELERVWGDRYQSRYGFWRPYVMDVIYKYLGCGDLHQGFARVKCDECHHEYLLPFSCKRRYFCPSCHQKRVVEFGEFLYSEVLKQVPHRQWVFSIPKRLRPYFMYDRKLLPKLSLCAWKVLSCYLKHGVSDEEAMPGAAIAVQTFGDFLNFNPHLHIIATDGCFVNDGNFMNRIVPNPDDLEIPFRCEVLYMLRREGKITNTVVDNMDSWHHSGFHVYCGNSILPDDEEGLEKLAKYIVRAPISQERMLYIPSAESINGMAQVIYTGKNSKIDERFTALDWLARLVTHIPNKGEQLVRYYGYYSNKARGIRKKAEEQQQKADEPETSMSTPCLIESDISKKAFRRNWARLIKKVYNIDPLICPKCNSKMRIIGFIEEEAVIEKILKHLNLWLPGHDPPYNNKSSRKTLLPSILDIDYNNIILRTRRDSISQMPYEDEYSQESPYVD